MWWRTSNCSPLLIYRSREDERLSWPGWLTYSGRLTHISGHPSATGWAQDAIEHWPETDVLPLSHADQPVIQYHIIFYLPSVAEADCRLMLWCAMNISILSFHHIIFVVSGSLLQWYPSLYEYRQSVACHMYEIFERKHLNVYFVRSCKLWHALM